jgi:imidazoleglycerol-phosphate dehydratase / histidinol-phosphatase
VMVSNQDGRGTPSFPEESFRKPHAMLMDILSSQGIRFAAEFICPHFANDDCDCRKPKVGLLTDFLRATPIDKSNSYVIGDRESDIELAKNLDVKSIRIASRSAAVMAKANAAASALSESWGEIADRLARPIRRGNVVRKTRETDISVSVDLDSEGPIHTATGLGFFDHMLEQIAKHGGFALKLSCKGDLHIDEHHTVEDCALALGQALKTALGDKRGIHRYGFLLPMDESLAQVAIDLSGRPYFVFEGQFGRDQVGQLPTELVPHFFRSLAETLGAAINIKVTGDNTHHMIEACFKGVGRTLRQAIRIADTELPSTKGSL